jgi:hypothetical protein
MEIKMIDLINKLMNKLDNDYSGFKMTTGNKYIKVISYVKPKYEGAFGQQSVHAFIDKKTGDIYKPASWNAPAKHVRFNIYNDIDLLLEKADRHGGYLYK